MAIKTLTEAFQRLDTDRDGWIQINYDTFLSVSPRALAWRVTPVNLTKPLSRNLLDDVERALRETVVTQLKSLYIFEV